jgi:geranylgeranylglycerol-phosphate geranylgeranyltransferase
LYIEKHTMASLLPYLKIARLHNTVLTGIAVGTGFWLGNSTLSLAALALLAAASIAATAFGNVANDIEDLATDRISHADRPLPRGELSLAAARRYAAGLALLSITSATFVSWTHGAATLLPLALLALYTRFLKGTPLAGNIVVSILVGYAPLYGALQAPGFTRLIVPALLAFLLNLVREIVKDLQDEPGDRSANIITTAALPLPVIRSIIYTVDAAYLLLLFVPVIVHHFGMVYALIAAIGIVPLQIFCMFLSANIHERSRLPLLSLLIKVEMALGLVALAADRLLVH